MNEQQLDIISAFSPASEECEEFVGESEIHMVQCGFEVELRHEEHPSEFVEVGKEDGVFESVEEVEEEVLDARDEFCALHGLYTGRAFNQLQGGDSA